MIAAKTLLSMVALLLIGTILASNPARAADCTGSTVKQLMCLNGKVKDQASALTELQAKLTTLQGKLDALQNSPPSLVGVKIQATHKGAGDCMEWASSGMGGTGNVGCDSAHRPEQLWNIGK